jgi:hypothetical protein
MVRNSHQGQLERSPCGLTSVAAEVTLGQGI